MFRLPKIRVGFRLPNFRAGFRLSHKITALGAIGIVGLVLIGGLYLVNLSYQNAYKKIQHDAQAMDARVSRLNVSLLESRRAEKDFLLQHDMKFAKRHAALSKTNIQEIEKLRQQASSAGHKQLVGEVKQIAKGIKAYAAAFTELVQAGSYLGLNETSGLRGALRDAAKAMASTFDKLDQPRLLAGMLKMRQTEKDFQLNPDEKYGQAMEKLVAEFGKMLATSTISDDAKNDIQQKLEEYQSQFSAYMQGVISLMANQKAAADAYAAVEPIINSVTKHIENVNANAAAAAEKSDASTKLMMEIVFLLDLLAIALFGFVVSRSISKPLRALNKGMLELADGNFDVALPGLGRKDEIGDIAGSVETFKVKATEKAKREAAEKAEQDKKVAAERDAAMEKIASDFEEAVGGIVQAAVAGDFSQRVDLEGKSGLVLHIGTAINSLCENVAKALDDLITMLNALADGDLTQRITTEYQGNFAILKDNANMTAERIGATITEIKHAAREVTNASAEISNSTTDLSQRTEEQAASLEQTSASMEEMSATVKKNAENAQAADRLATGTRGVADRGGEVVAQAVNAMARIEDSSRKIADIIGVIDEIARQTNLLALNAAVEAARAGEAGRGFAVVASEVRSLAQRSSQAAKDIKDLITNSNGQVKEGVELVNKAGTSLTEIVESIKKVAEVVSDIAAASAEQAAGLDQVNKALAQMDEMTQQNSALVEENAATAKTLEHQAVTMTERVAFFLIDEGAAVQGAPQAVDAAA
jgi:methyl-accepting chemotaxis protein